MDSESIKSGLNSALSASSFAGALLIYFILPLWLLLPLIALGVTLLAPPVAFLLLLASAGLTVPWTVWAVAALASVAWSATWGVRWHFRIVEHFSKTSERRYWFPGKAFTQQEVFEMLTFWWTAWRVGLTAIGIVLALSVAAVWWVSA